MHGVGTKIDVHIERIFHQHEIFIVSPEEGLEVGRDLQSDLQSFLKPPRGRAVAVKRWRTGLRVGGHGVAMKNRPAAGEAKASAMPRTDCKQTVECKGECEPAADGEAEPLEDGKAE
jgi:hypothetical protein